MDAREEGRRARFCAGHGEGFWGLVTWDRDPNEGLKGTRHAEEAGRAEASLVEKAQAGLCHWRGPGEVRRSWGSSCPGLRAVVKRPWRACDMKALGAGWWAVGSRGLRGRDSLDADVARLSPGGGRLASPEELGAPCAVRLISLPLSLSCLPPQV